MMRTMPYYRLFVFKGEYLALFAVLLFSEDLFALALGKGQTIYFNWFI
jgi:hypothetical protein